MNTSGEPLYANWANDTNLQLKDLDDDYLGESEADVAKEQVDNVVEESKAWTSPKDAKILHIKEDVEGIPFAESYIAGFRQFKILSWALFRFPLEYHRVDGRFEFYWSPFEGVIFLITAVFIALLTVFYAINLMSVILNFPLMNADTGIGGGPTIWHARAEEMFIFYRNCAIAVMFGMLLVHVCVANWKTYQMRIYIASYLSYFTNALDLMKLYAAKDLSRFMMYINLGFMGFLLVLIALMVARLSPITSGGPGFIGILLVRIMYPAVYQDADLYGSLKVVAQIILIYFLIAAKLQVILFIYQCKVIRGAYHLWNQRLDLVLNRGDDYLVLEDRLGKRTSFRELFHDHTILLDLIDGADMLFGETIESYYIAQILSMIFEMYWFWRGISGDEFTDVRRLDVIFIGIYLCHSLFFILYASFTAASVKEEAMDGLEVIRRKGMFGRKSPEELYFLMSLYVSYSGHFDVAITGGGYSSIDRSFLVGVCGTILSYFIVLIQFSHPLDLGHEDPLKLIMTGETRLIRRVEDTYVWSTKYDMETDN